MICIKCDRPTTEKLVCFSCQDEINKRKDLEYSVQVKRQIRDMVGSVGGYQVMRPGKLTRLVKIILYAIYAKKSLKRGNRTKMH